MAIVSVLNINKEGVYSEKVYFGDLYSRFTKKVGLIAVLRFFFFANGFFCEKGRLLRLLVVLKRCFRYTAHHYAEESGRGSGCFHSSNPIFSHLLPFICDVKPAFAGLVKLYPTLIPNQPS